MSLTSSSIKKPVTTLMVFLCVAVVGFISLKLLPLEFMPDMTFPFVGIQVPYPGSTPEEIEREIARPIEEALATISGINRMFSNSDENGCFVGMNFNWEEEIDIKSLEAKEKVDGIRHLLPDDLERYFILKFNTSDEEILTLRLSSNRDLSNAYDMLNRNIKQRLERIEGVSKVDLYGVEKKEVSIKLDPERIMAHQVDLRNLIGMMRNSNFSLSSGRITDANRRLTVRPVGEFKNIYEYENLIINERNLKLNDIAQVTYDQPERFYGRHLDMKYAIGLDIFKESGANTIMVTNAIIGEIEEIEKLPEMQGISIYHMNNQAEGIISSLEELFKSGMLGALLATMVLYFFLRRFSTTFIVTLAVPFSLLVTLACMYFLNITLNILSMMGLMLAVGMLVDNAVVATESIHRHQQLNGDMKKATITGVKEIALAITAGTITTIIVFLPQIVSSDDQIAIQLRHVAIALCISLVASLILAQTIVPLLASRVKPVKKEKKSNIIDQLIRKYAKLLEWTLNHKGWSSLAILFIILSIIIPMNAVQFDMFPDQQSDRKLYLNYYINDSYTLEKVEQTVYKIEQYLYDNKEELDIDNVYSYYQPDFAASTILLKKDNEATKSQQAIQDSILANLPTISLGQPSFEHRHHGENTGKTVSVRLIGRSSDLLAELSKEVAWILGNIPGIQNARSDAERGDKEIHVRVDREKSARYGFSSRDVAMVVSSAMRGVNLAKYKTKTGEIDVKVQYQEQQKQNMSDLENLPIFDDNNNMHKLTSLADFEVKRGPNRIFREDRMTNMAIQVQLGDMPVGEAREKIAKVMDQYRLPAGYIWTFGQRFNFEEEAAQTMLTNILLALVLIYLVMAALFESLVFPAGIWSSILFSIVGVYWFFLLTGTVMSMMGLIGILILIGVVVNNGIVLVDHIINLRKQGLAREEAIIQAGKDRLRPIIMTAATTIFSLLPLTMVTTQIGGGGPPYFPMARAIVGGLTFATFITLLILPTIYVLLDNMRNWAGRVVNLAFNKSKVS